MTEITSEALRDPSQFQKLLAEAHAADAGTSAPQGQEQAAEPADDVGIEEAPADTEEQPEAGDAEGGEDAEPPEQSDADDQPQPEAQDDEPEEVTKPVPPSRLKKEVEKRREAEAEAAAAKAEAAAMKAQVAEFNKMLAEQIEASRAPKEPAQADEPEIDLAELDKLDALDPDTTKALVGMIKGLQKKVETLEGTTTQRTLVADAKADVAVFRQSTPDYDAAVTHLGTVEYHKALAVLGDEGMARQAAQAAVAQIAKLAAANGKGVAQILYNAAKAVGYRKAEAKPAAPAKKADPAKLAENRAKTESAASVPAAAPNPLGIYTTKEGFDKLRVRDGGKVDPAKFNALLKKAQGGKFVA